MVVYMHTHIHNCAAGEAPGRRRLNERCLLLGAKRATPEMQPRHRSRAARAAAPAAAAASAAAASAAGAAAETRRAAAAGLLRRLLVSYTLATGTPTSVTPKTLPCPRRVVAAAAAAAAAGAGSGGGAQRGGV